MSLDIEIIPKAITYCARAKKAWLRKTVPRGVENRNLRIKTNPDIVDVTEREMVQMEIWTLRAGPSYLGNLVHSLRPLTTDPLHYEMDWSSGTRVSVI